jgi:nitrite reductase/ring-hydroxylating ferredoxin subunit
MNDNETPGRLMGVCRVEAVPPGEMNHFMVGESEILVINLAGQFHCFSARCTHAGAPLVEGEIQEGILICPWHYSHFRISDGSVLEGPAEKPLPKYDFVIRDNTIFVEI